MRGVCPEIGPYSPSSPSRILEALGVGYFLTVCSNVHQQAWASVQACRESPAHPAILLCRHHRWSCALRQAVCPSTNSGRTALGGHLLLEALGAGYFSDITLVLILRPPRNPPLVVPPRMAAILFRSLIAGGLGSPFHTPLSVGAMLLCLRAMVLKPFAPGHVLLSMWTALLNQTSGLQGCCDVSCGILAGNDPGTGSGWQQSRPNRTPLCSDEIVSPNATAAPLASHREVSLHLFCCAPSVVVPSVGHTNTNANAHHKQLPSERSLQSLPL